MESIGRYRLLRRIVAGSFATVWLGHDDDLDVPVAVKVLAENWAGNSDVRNRFLVERALCDGFMIDGWFRCTTSAVSRMAGPTSSWTTSTAGP